MIEPKQAQIDKEQLVGIPVVDENDCGNWKLIDTLFVDNSGFGQDDEPALTIEQFYEKIKAGFAYGVIDAGQFQVHVGVFEITDDLCAEHKPSAELTVTYFNFSPVRDLTDDELLSPFYSEFACQTCGSELAGDRYYCTATIDENLNGLVEKLEICADCYEYFFT